MSSIKRVIKYIFNNRSLQYRRRVIQLSDSIVSNNIEGIRASIEHGVDPNVSLAREKPLHLAARSAALPTVKALIELGSDPLVFDSNGLRPSFHARCLGRTDIADYLEKAEISALFSPGRATIVRKAP